MVQFGTVANSELKKADVNKAVFYADINWDMLLMLVKNNSIAYKEVAKYPSVRRDLSLLLDNAVTFQSIYELARQTEKSLLKNINLFDVYQGKNLPEGKKSYAVSFTIQDTTKTLTDVQIDKIMSKLQKNLETELGASLR